MALLWIQIVVEFISTESNQSKAESNGSSNWLKNKNKWHVISFHFICSFPLLFVDIRKNQSWRFVICIVWCLFLVLCSKSKSISIHLCVCVHFIFVWLVSHCVYLYQRTVVKTRNDDKQENEPNRFVQIK